VGLHREKLRYSPDQKTWAILRENLLEKHREEDPPSRARDTVRGWINYLGPGFLHVRDGALTDLSERVLRAAADCGFREICPPTELQGWISGAAASWQAVRERHRRGESVKGAQPSDSVGDDLVLNNYWRVPPPDLAPL
jgi:hypothetical protein